MLVRSRLSLRRAAKSNIFFTLSHTQINDDDDDDDDDDEKGDGDDDDDEGDEEEADEGEGEEQPDAKRQRIDEEE